MQNAQKKATIESAPAVNEYKQAQYEALQKADVIDDGWESFELSDEFRREVPRDERHDSLRSLANKTQHIRKGKTRHIAIVTENHLYLFDANGYMTGRIEDSIVIDADESRAKREYKEFVKDANKDSKDARLWADAVSDIRGESGGRISVSAQKRSSHEKNDRVFGIKREGDRGRNNGEAFSDFEDDVSEYSPGTVYFDGEHGYIVEQDGTS